MERVEDLADDMETTYKLRPLAGAGMEEMHSWLADLRRIQVRSNPDIRQNNADQHLEQCEKPPGRARTRNQRANPPK